MNTLHNSYTHCQAAGRCNELLKLIVNLVIFKTNIKENRLWSHLMKDQRSYLITTTMWD